MRCLYHFVIWASFGSSVPCCANQLGGGLPAEHWRRRFEETQKDCTLQDDIETLLRLQRKRERERGTITDDDDDDDDNRYQICQPSQASSPESCSTISPTMSHLVSHGPRSWKVLCPHLQELLALQHEAIAQQQLFEEDEKTMASEWAFE